MRRCKVGALAYGEERGCALGAIPASKGVREGLENRVPGLGPPGPGLGHGRGKPLHNEQGKGLGESAGSGQALFITLAAAGTRLQLPPR